MIDGLRARLRSLLESRFRISTQLYLSIGGSVALTIAASLVGWFSFNRMGDVQKRVNEGSIPELGAAFGVAQLSGVLVAAAPRLSAAEKPDDFSQVAFSIAEAHQDLEEQLAVLERRDSGDERFKRIRAHADALIVNIKAIRSDISEVLELNARSATLRTELAELSNHLEGVVFPAIDDQFFYTMTGYRKLGEPPASRPQHFSENELRHYRHLADLQADANIATQLLASAFTLADGSLIEPLRERFEASAGRIERSLSALGESSFRAGVAPIFARLFELGAGEQGCLDLLVREFSLAKRQRDLLDRNRDIAIDLVAEVDGLVNASRASAEDVIRASNQAILRGRTLLLAISGLSIGGALLIAWLFVGRVLLSRLSLLSERMRRMAGGDLEGKVGIGGRDEVADMAAALEVFRRHALEVQRLNLVEKLAEELRGKNAQLESVLADLQKAQDQIVMREKLAALGELTAGVAHEIRNPLNFVKNFSEVSEELLEELLDILRESGEKLSADQHDLVQEIIQDLTDNLNRIREHGERANRIVQDMLMMGRGSGERKSADINKLLDEHARLAYHSARAADPNFQLDLKQDLDPQVGEIEVIPQDLGRVFLNMVSNACDATDEKRRAAAEAGEETAAYNPTLWISSRTREDQVEVRIKDNGDGIPPDAIDKIFNPFFTTKPTDRGTGLGLALSNDIVREHGGSIRVESQPGQFTEMIIEIPVTPPSATLEGDAGDKPDPEEVSGSPSS